MQSYRIGATRFNRKNIFQKSFMMPATILLAICLNCLLLQLGLNLRHFFVVFIWKEMRKSYIRFCMIDMQILHVYHNTGN